MQKKTRQIKKKPEKTLRTSKDFINAGLVDESMASSIEQVAEHFSFALTSTMKNQIKCSSIDDPVAKQFVPSPNELITTQDELSDPIGDDAHSPIKGIVHRYPDRCLLAPISVCPVYCRFCFRREKVGPGNQALSPSELECAYEYIENDKNIWEVILTGGDPLIMKPKKLASILKRLDQIAHVGVVRIHTRIPVVQPDNITDAMVTALKLKNKPIYVVLHINHPNEFSAHAKRACATLVDNGIPLLSQSVLLKSINDNSETLTKLMRLLIQNRIKPYYLHHADKAKGTSHFRTSIEEGQQLMTSLRGNISGICQPTYVLDIPGGFGKVPLSPSYISEPKINPNGVKQYRITDYQFTFHEYIEKS